MGQKLKFDLTGNRYGRLTVLSRVPGNKWLCRCDCGTEKQIYGGSLRNGLSQSCGCLNIEVQRAKREDLTGKRYGRWSVLGPGDDYEHWRCRCDCGTERDVGHASLRKGFSRSCGCLKLEMVRKVNKTHGLTRTPAHRSWVAMRQRCYNPKTTRYSRYGGRGIKVCDRWRYSFEEFLKDMGQPPSDRHSIDRIDVDGDYEPGNCRWATPLEQRHNRGDS